METPHLPVSIFGSCFENVYEPAEDTFLLLDALEKDLECISARAMISLECGSGSGIVITALSKFLSSTNSRLMLATDINMHACRTTSKCAKYHHQNGIQVVRTDLAQALIDRLKNSVDLLLFNPPYVPTSEEETSREIGGHINLSWAGGHKGRQLIDTFLDLYVPNLLSRPLGLAYMVAINENNIEELLGYLMDKHKIKGSVVMQRKAGTESLYIIKYEWIC